MKREDLQEHLEQLIAPDQAASGGMDAEELSELIGLFHESTASLRASHERLRLRIDEMTHELAGKNRELSGKVEELSALKNYLASILESISDGVLTVDLERRLVARNEAAIRLLPDMGACANGGGELFPAEKATERSEAPESTVYSGVLAGILDEAVATESVIASVEIRTPGADGSTRYLSVSAAPIRNAAGQLMGAVATFRDNTEVRELEKVVQRQDRLAAMGEMAAQLAHEIRNPLGGIELFASLLDRSLSDRPEEQELAKKIETATSSLNRLVEDMLTFTRPANLNLTAVAGEWLFDGALQLAGEALASKNIQLQRQCIPETWVWVDPDALQRALLNVILNAVQLMEDGGTLTLTSQPDPHHPRQVRLEVADTGPGVPEELREQVFNPFFTRRQEGTGLGLAIVQKIVQEHNGAVSIEANQPQGARFIFSLPAPVAGAGG